MNEIIIAVGCLVIVVALLAGAVEFVFWLWPAEEIPDYKNMTFVIGHTPKPPTPFVDGEPQKNFLEGNNK